MLAFVKLEIHTCRKSKNSSKKWGGIAFLGSKFISDWRRRRNFFIKYCKNYMFSDEFWRRYQIFGWILRRRQNFSIFQSIICSKCPNRAITRNSFPLYFYSSKIYPKLQFLLKNSSENRGVPPLFPIEFLHVCL